MTRERILATRPDGGVIVACPSEWGISALMTGGAWAEHHPMFWMLQFNRMIRRGVRPDAAHRYARTMLTGGASRREAIEIIAGRDCGHRGTAIEIIDVSDIPKDRKYRSAWRRSRNGGPIWIDEEIAQQLDERRMWKDYEWPSDI